MGGAETLVSLIEFADVEREGRGRMSLGCDKCVESWVATLVQSKEMSI